MVKSNRRKGEILVKYGYARVSTLNQDLESQIQMLQKEGCEEIYSEKFTGTKFDRPKFQELLSVVETGDTLVVTKLDRFARSAENAIQTIRMLFEKGVKVHILNMGVVEDTPTGRLMFNIMSSFAEFERDMIVERTQEGKAIAKMNPDFKEGRPKKYNKKQIEHALDLLKTKSYRQVEEMTGISVSTLQREKRKRSAEKEKEK
ncbi:recombinase family protein [Bacillus paranthracis]|uniref:recombinase family protein n=1 Tax=Bacillus cereus group TaxID=86661 RepID=UPI001592BBE7|nr:MULTISPECIES: recombinase family protein [Bacillus cereus group]MEC3360538.1 recombinase family protein [Bacillus paranthracis]MED0786617.1 recombinase family protein [Bacillus paranthracis]MED0813184.1 recombinase family protein [Bacillus paranthracis]MED0818898.1 recombinase family protein [Bacillus paranthracis]MED0862258.1 recombinase family protein [Bacillus paranthracis]